MPPDDPEGWEHLCHHLTDLNEQAPARLRTRARRARSRRDFDQLCFSTVASALGSVHTLARNRAEFLGRRTGWHFEVSAPSFRRLDDPVRDIASLSISCTGVRVDLYSLRLESHLPALHLALFARAGCRRWGRFISKAGCRLVLQDGDGYSAVPCEPGAAASVEQLVLQAFELLIAEVSRQMTSPCWGEPRKTRPSKHSPEC